MSHGLVHFGNPWLGNLFIKVYNRFVSTSQIIDYKLNEIYIILQTKTNIKGKQLSCSIR